MANFAVVHTETHDENKPAGSRARSLGDDDIREYKRAIRERLAVDHLFLADESGEDAIGIHKQITMRASGAAPTAYDDIGSVYLKTVSGKIELFYRDSDGNEIQITTGGILNDSVLAKSGDWMISTVTTTRAGWTNVSATYTDKFMRINGTPLSTGGSDTHTTPAHTLTVDEIPAHTHNSQLYQESPGSTNRPLGGDNGGSAQGTGTTAATGGGGGHEHAAASNVPVYVQVVVFQKN